MERNTRVQAKRLTVYTGHTGNLYALAVDKALGYIYTSGTDGLVIRWDINVFGEGKVIAKLGEAVHCLQVEEGQNRLWVGSAKGQVHVVDLTEKKEIKLFASHALALFDIKQLGAHMYSAGGDGCVVKYSLQDLSIEKVKKLSDKSIRCIAIDEVGNKLAAGSSDGNIYLLSKNLEIYDEIIAAHESSVFSLVFSREGQCLLSGGRDAMLCVWDLVKGVKNTHKIAAHNLHVHGLSVQAEGQYFLSSSMDKTIKIWDLHDFSLLRVMDKERHQAHVNSINKIAWMSDDKFVSISDDKSVMLWALIS
jgi:WD40 repeat protein